MVNINFEAMKDKIKEILKNNLEGREHNYDEAVTELLNLYSVMPCFEFSGVATKYNEGVYVDTDGIALSNDTLPHKAYTLEEGVKYTVKIYKA